MKARRFLGARSALVIAAVALVLASGLALAQTFNLRRNVAGIGGNLAPVWKTAPDLGAVPANTAFSVTLEAPDPQGQAVTFSLHLNDTLPPGFSLSGAVLSGQTPEVAAPTSYSFGIIASDPDGNIAGQQFSLTVQGTEYSYSAWSDWGACSASCGEGTHDRARQCQRSGDDQAVDCSLCGGQCGQTEACLFTEGCSYAWIGDAWGLCGGGTGSWSSAAWGSCAGAPNECGTGSQSRGNACLPDTDSGSQSRTVWCRRADGAQVADTFCDSGSRPTGSQACTPASAPCAAPEPATSQACDDSSGCVATNNCSAYGTCTGGTATWLIGDWDSCSTACSQGRTVACNGGDTDTGTQTRTCQCERFYDGAWQATTGCEPPTLSQACTPEGVACAAPEPEATQSCSGDSCAYAWVSSSWATCAGGTGAWTSGAWSTCAGAPASCGTGSQSRSNSCVPDTDSGSQGRTVTCQRADGATVADSFCPSESRPADSQACTPASVDCGTEPAASQSCGQTDGCVPTNNCGAWGGCTGGTASWLTGGWSSCATSCSQTRSVSCSGGDANTGTQARSCACQRFYDGAWQATTGCATPTTSQACTPTGVSCNAGSQPVASQACSGDACSYAWSAGSFGTCTGGAGTWSSGAWGTCSGAPNACGTGSQARTNSCTPNANSGSQARSVVCLRADGATVADAFCVETKPATSQACTPASAPCGTEPATSQSCSQTSGCTPTNNCGSWGSCTGGTATWLTGGWSSCATSCSQTRSVSCNGGDANTGSQTRSCSCQRYYDGAWENTTGCATPTTSQACTPTGVACSGAAPDDTQACTGDSCSYAWSSGSWGSCGGGTGTWSSGNWGSCSGAPNSCGTGSQTRTNTCSPDANSGSQSRTVVCLRADGQQVPDSRCAETKPATSQACTPASAPCGTEPATSQSCSQTSGCTPTNNCGSWGSCTGGTASWLTGGWSSCATNCSQSRTVSCSGGDANSGSQTRSCTCQRYYDNAWQNTTGCSTPTTSQACTPTGVACSGGAPASSQSCTGGSCAYAWVTDIWTICSGGTNTPGSWGTCAGGTNSVGAWGTCAGGSASVGGWGTCTGGSAWTGGWSTCTGGTSWVGGWGNCDGSNTSNVNCGTGTQYRSAGCNNNGSQSRSVGCNNDGTQTRSASCNTNSGSQTRTASCNTNSGSQTRTASCNTNSGSQTRLVYCQRSDGATVSDSFCVAAKPAISQSCTPGTLSDCGNPALSQACTPSTLANCGNPATSQACTPSTLANCGNPATSQNCTASIPSCGNPATTQSCTASLSSCGNPSTAQGCNVNGCSQIHNYQFNRGNDHLRGNNLCACPWGYWELWAWRSWVGWMYVGIQGPAPGDWIPQDYWLRFCSDEGRQDISSQGWSGLTTDCNQGCKQRARVIYCSP